MDIEKGDSAHHLEILVTNLSCPVKHNLRNEGVRKRVKSGWIWDLSAVPLLGSHPCFCEEPRRLLICQAELDGILWSSSSFSGWCDATALHGYKACGALTTDSERIKKVQISRNTDIEKLRSGGRGSLKEKPQNPRNSACVLYTIDQGGGVIAKIWGRRQDLQYTAGSRREVYLISMGAFSVLSSGTKYLPGWGDWGKNCDISGTQYQHWHSAGARFSQVCLLSTVHTHSGLHTSKDSFSSHRVDRCFFFKLPFLGK